MDARDSYSDPHLKERGFLVEVTHQDSGTHLYPGAAWKFSKMPIQVRRTPVRFGGDNEYVYKHVLGVSDKGYEALLKAGHISVEPAPHLQ